MSKKKRNAILIGMIVGAIVIIAGVIIWSLTSDYKTQQISNSTPAVSKKTYKKKKERKYVNPNATDDPVAPAKHTRIKNTKIKSKLYLYRTNIPKMGNGTPTEDDNLKKYALNELCTQQFKTYQKWMQKSLGQYRFEKGVGKDIGGIYLDEQNFESILNDDSMPEKKAGLTFAANAKTPESFAILGLTYDQIARATFILDPDSISPTGFSDLKYLGTSAYNDPDQIANLPAYNGFKAAQEMYKLDGNTSVYIVHLSLNDDTHTIPYDAIVGESISGKLALLGYYTSAKYSKVITDKPLRYFFQKKFRDQYENAADNQRKDIEKGNVNTDKLYPWIEKGGTFN